ncbi:hypothetical protein K1719_011236 [Acacia pycnantha]|nr:hypothetical protein K1719_011236 [Acacia pycnantha]
MNVPTIMTMIRKGWHLDKEVEIHELDRSQLTFLFRFQERRSCKEVAGSRSKDAGPHGFGSWLGTATVRTLEEAVVFCRSNWCENNLEDRSGSERSGDASESSSSCRSLPSELLVLLRGNVDPRSERCQKGAYFCELSSHTLSCPCQLNSAYGRVSAALPPPKSQRPVCVEELIPTEEDLSPSSVQGAGGSTNEARVVVRKVGLEVGNPIDLGLASGAGSDSSLSESGPLIHLKRPCDDSLVLDLVKRARRLNFEDSPKPHFASLSGNQSQRGRRRSYRSLKSQIRSQVAASSSTLDMVHSIGSEIDFPDSWLTVLRSKLDLARLCFAFLDLELVDLKLKSQHLLRDSVKGSGFTSSRIQ